MWIKKIYRKVLVSFSLGVENVIRIAVYRCLLSIGYYRRLSVSAGIFENSKKFFIFPELPKTNFPTVDNWSNSATLFGHVRQEISKSPPNWSENVFTGAEGKDLNLDWWAIQDFDSSLGDIKGVWEYSRFDWVMAFSQRVREGDTQELERLNSWLDNWCQKNPGYKGYNWKCGQEASIRVLHLAVAALILGQVESASESLKQLVAIHLLRISATVQYARAQDNDHGTSEAAALYIGGDWLARTGDRKGRKWKEKGAWLLEERGCRLISRDGTFSQYSVNYHRFVLETYSLVAVWKIRNGDLGFTSDLYERLNAATLWLARLTESDTGGAPNIGGNDSVNLLSLTNSALNDFRPSIQLAGALFLKSRIFKNPGLYDVQLQWLGLEIPNKVIDVKHSFVADDGGFAIIREKSCFLVMRYPRFRFRPSQCDVLHIGFFCGREELLRDGGSYSYSTSSMNLDDFSGVSGHNTIQFDDRQQMPKISRFLWGDWVKTDYFEALREKNGVQTFEVGYSDRHGAAHRRLVALGGDYLKVTDRISGFKKSATLRWRLAPSNWELTGNLLSDGYYKIKVESTAKISRMELVEGWESRHYMEKTRLPVLEIVLETPGNIISEFSWPS